MVPSCSDKPNSSKRNSESLMAKVERDHRLALTYSMLSTALQCYQKYKYLYIDKLDSGLEYNGHIEFGTAVHTSLEAMFNGGGGVEVFEMYWDSVKDTELKFNR